MNPTEIAILKDKILKQLSDRTNKRESLLAIYNNLNDKSIPIEVVEGYMFDMIINGTIKDIHVEGKVFEIEAKGEKILYEGGYVKLLEEKIIEDKIIAEDLTRKREKDDLEIRHLTWTKWFSIIALIISILSFLFSIFKK